MAQGPLFLARAVYRRRRLRDAGRLLPVLGLLLLVLPGLGQGNTESAGQTAIYIFVVWALLIAAAAALAHRTAAQRVRRRQAPGPGLRRLPAAGAAAADASSRQLENRSSSWSGLPRLAAGLWCCSLC